MDIASTLKKLERQVRERKGASAEILHLAERGLPRAFAAKFANLAWRAGEPMLGIRILHPIVRPSQRSPKEATAEEKAEYAVCLTKIGAWEEGQQLLRSIDTTKCPQAILYLAFDKVARWDYAASLPLLKQYLATRGLSAYQRVVGEMNLAAALVEDHQYLKADILLKDLTYRLSLPKYYRLLGRAFELWAENFIHQKKWAKVEACLTRAENILGDSEGMDLFFVRKFRAVSTFLQAKNKRESEVQLKAIRAEAATRRHWETIRDCDRILALGNEDEKLWNRVYFGTPLDGFRDRMKALAPELPILSTFRLEFQAAKPDSPTLDLVTGKTPRKAPSLKPGQALHRLLLIFASDFYRPFRSASLFSTLYPDQYFDPVTSPSRVRQSIQRLRNWFETAGIPFLIQESEGYYQLSATKPAALILPEPAKTGARHEILLAALRKELEGKSFSNAEACRVWKLSPRASLRILESGVQDQIIRREGTKKTARYYFETSEAQVLKK